MFLLIKAGPAAVGVHIAQHSLVGFKKLVAPLLCLSSEAAQAPEQASCQNGTWRIVFGSVRSLQLLHVRRL
jgi:hypothetical protein